MAVSEGANMPSTPEAIKVFQDAKILYAPGKAANAGGVSVSGLEMTQNSIKLSWSAEEVDEKLKSIMKNIHEACVQYGTEADGYVNYVKGANVAGFMKVAKAMMALVGIERRLGRLPARVPDGIAVLDVVVASVLIERRIVITVTGQTQKFCIFVEAVSAAGVGNQRKEVLRSQIVDPRKRSLRACDDILFFRIIKMSKLHV